MAISIAQYVDLLFKKLQGVAKTANATVKGASNESIASPPLLRADVIWTDSGNIPNVASQISGLTQAYLGANSVQCGPDTTVPPIGGIYPTWLANTTYWIPQEFGATWLPKVYVGPAGAGNIQATGTQIFAVGSGGTGEYYFDTQAGVLNFIGETIPAVLTAGNVVYIAGYQYVGAFGLGSGGGGNAAALTVSLIDSGNVITNAVSNVEFLRFDSNSGFGVENLGNGNVKISLGSTFKTWVIGNSAPGQPNLVASGEDIVQFVQGNGIAFTSNNTPTGAAYKSLTIDVNLSSYTSNITTSGNISGGYILGNGAFLTGISGGANLGNITITAANISTNIVNGNVGLSGNGSGRVFLSNVLPWNASTGLSNNTVDLGNSSYQFKDLYVGNVITPAGTLGNATQIQPAPGVGQSGVAFRDAVTGSAADVSAGVMYVDAIDATGSIITDSYVEGNELISLGNLTVGDNANIANGLKVTGYANFLGNLKAENIAAVTNIEAQFYYGNGFYLTGINAANLIGAYSNTNVANYLPVYNGNILAGNLTVSNNVIIQGNLQVLGNTTTINANTLTINDLDIIVANGASTPSQANGAGLIVGASNIANIIYLSTPNYWSFNPGIYTVGNITTESNVNVTGNITANNATIVNTLTADNGNFTCCLEIGGATTTYFQAYTTSNAANQTLYEANAAASAQLDFNIIATDPTLMGGSRQSSKILSTTYGNSTDFVEYGGVYINTPVGDFAVDQANGNVRLLVSPQTNANIGYSVLVTRLV